MSEEFDQSEVIERICRLKPPGFDRQAIQPDHVEWAISSLVSAGVYPSLRWIAKVLGGPSQKSLEPLVLEVFRARGEVVIPEVSKTRPDAIQRLYEVVASDIREDVLRGLAVEFDHLEAAGASARELQQTAEAAMAEVNRQREAMMEAVQVLRMELGALNADRDSLLEKISRKSAELDRATFDLDQQQSRLLAFETEVAALNDRIGRLSLQNSEKDTLLAVATRDLGLAKAALDAECRISSDLSTRLAEIQERVEASRSALEELLESRDRLLGEAKRLRNQLDGANAKLSRERVATAQFADQLERTKVEVQSLSALLATAESAGRDLERRLAQARAEISVLQSRLEDKTKQCRVERAGRLAIERKYRRHSLTPLRNS